jgi:hypothetical protein
VYPWDLKTLIHLAAPMMKNLTSEDFDGKVYRASNQIEILGIPTPGLFP